MVRDYCLKILSTRLATSCAEGWGTAGAPGAVGVEGGPDTSIGEYGGESLDGVVSIGESTSVTHGEVFLAKLLAAKYVVLVASIVAADVDAAAPASDGGVGRLEVGSTFAPSCGSSRTRRSGGGRCWPGDIVLRRLGGDGTDGMAAVEDDG